MLNFTCVWITENLINVLLRIATHYHLNEDHVDSLSGKKYYACIDLKDGFDHVKVSEHSQKCTYFTTPLSKFSYLGMPFGICNGPSIFQRFVNNSFKDLIKQKRIIVYFYYIIIATETIDEHLVFFLTLCN